MKRRFSKALSLLICLGMLAVAWPQPTRAQTDIASGKWTGYFERIVTITNNVSGVEITAKGFGKGNIELTVEPGGKVSGSMTDYHAEVSWSAPAVKVEGGCTIDLAFSGLDGTVADGPDHLPVFDMTLGNTDAKFVCNPDIGQANSPPHSVTMKATTASSGQITGEQVRFDTDMVEQVLANVAKTGAQTSLSEYWELNSSGATVDVISAEREMYFLAGVPFKNTYTALIDWHDNPPGTVDFSLVGQTQNVPDNQPAQAAFELGTLPAGNNPLTVTAIGADGTPSGSDTYDVIIVPLEPWAKAANFIAAETKMDEIIPVVIYRGKTGLPPKPLELPYLDMSWLPAIGGKWGIPPFQIEVNLSANSGGGPSDPEPVTGNPGLFLGGKSPALAIQVDGEAVTDLTETALLFDHGQVQFNLPATVFSHNVGVVDLIPGLSSVYSIPLLGDLVKSLNAVAGISLQTIASAKGQADLGVAPDKSALVFTQGQVTPAIELKAQPGINIFGLAWLNVSGGGKGEFTIQIAPDPQLKQCQFSLQFGANVGVQGLFSQSFSQPYKLVQCAPVSYNGRFGMALILPAGSLEAMPLAARDLPPVRPPSVEKAPAGQAAAGAFETLAAGLSPQSGYDLAAGPDGRLAFAYLDLDLNGQSRGLKLLLNDGQTWGRPLSVSQGQQAEFSPAVGFDGQGKLVLAWVQAGQAAPAGQLPDAAFFNSLEIQYAQVDPASGEILQQGSLTNDQILDFAPQLSQAPDGSLRIAWLQSPSGDLWGPADQPNRLMSALWQGDKWAAAETAVDSLTGSLGYRLAAYRQDRAVIVADQDVDGDPASATDREVYAFSLSGKNWKTTRLSDNADLDRAPLAAFTAAGEPVVVWEQGGSPVSLQGDLQAAPQAIDIEAAQAPDLSQAVLLAGGAGDLLLAWPDFDPPQSQVWYSRLPSGGPGWEPAASLADGLDGPAGLSARVAGTGEVVLALSDQHAASDSSFGRGSADSADLGLVRAVLLQPQSGDVSRAAGQTVAGVPFWLIGLCVVGVLGLLVVIGVGLILLRRRKQV